MVLVGHRGDPRHAPENTLASLDMAWRHGRRAVECDIRATRDGIPILCHDATLARVTGIRGPVAHRTWAQLRALETGRPIASLAQALAWLRRRSGDPSTTGGPPSPRGPAGPRRGRRRAMTVFLDVKVAGVERRIHQLICAAGMTRRCRVAASSPAVLQTFQRLTPRLPLYRVTGFHQPVTPRVVAHARRGGLRGLLPYKRWVTPAVCRRLTDAGLELYVWTIRDAADERRFRRLAVTGVMTERCRRSI